MKHHSSFRILAATLASLTFLGTVCAPATRAVGETADTPVSYNGTAITEHVGGYDHYDRTRVTHAYDFSVDRIGHYAIDPVLGMSNRAGAEIVDGALTTREGMDFAFGSAVGLGDDYGLEEGYLSFDLALTAGTVYLGLRTSRTACEPTARGIWFTFDGSDKMHIYEPECGLTAMVPMPISVAEWTTLSVHEELDTLTLSCGDTVIASVLYRADGYLAIRDGTETVLAETHKSEIYPSGYFELYLEDIEGAVDNVIFTNVEHVRSTPEAAEVRAIDYSTWTATDAIGRTVSENATVGDPLDNRYVGIFYFLCCTGAGLRVSDNTADYLKYGPENIKARIEERAGEAYWAEPYFGYYRNTDTWVYRKHAAMLEAAGVDFIFLDVSNGVVFEEGHLALFDTWLQMRREGNDTPQIVFMNGDTASIMDSNMRKLFMTVYSEENWDKYKELFFEWEGKPLLFGNMSAVGSDIKGRINETFTVRGNWAWQDRDNYWSWLQEYVSRGKVAQMTNGGWGRDSEGHYESLAIAMGHHPVTNKGRSFVNGKQPDNGLGDFEFSSIEQAGQGLGFAAQYKAVQILIDKKVPAEDPFVMLITGWNEWIAGGFTETTEKTLANTTCKVQYVDQFNPEFSRDGEPMRNKDGYGFGDNYYYQMVDIIRQYKGISATPVADHQGSINIYDLSEWDKIQMTYEDTLYDTALRNTICYDANYRYINNTGRNDLASAKMSQDGNAFYFLVTASHDLVIDDGETWMNLYLNTDGDSATGWAGYDYVLNRDRDSFVVSVEKFIDNTFETEVVGGAYYYLEGDSMAIRLSKELVGVEGLCERLIFKWADNSVHNGDPMAFMDLGDTAPDNRFGYLYLCDGYSTSALPAVTLTRESGTVPVNGVAIPCPNEDINITVNNKKVDILYDLSDITPGLAVTDTKLAEQFEYHIGTPQSTARIQSGKNLGIDGNCIAMKGYSDLRTWNDVEGAYEFSADVLIHTPDASGIFVRGEMPGAYAPLNPKNHNIKQVFHYYEWDWYRENGGSTYGTSSTAGSGIGIYPGASSITVRIKRYAEDGLGVASAAYTIPYTEDFKPAENGWLNIRCVDDCETLSIYFNNTLMCTAKLEQPGVTYASDGTGQEYYGLVTLFDASGTELLRVENTRVNSSGSQLALSSRNEPMKFTNIYIAFASQSTEGNRVETPWTTPDESVTYAPDDRLTTTLGLGRDTVPPDSETQPETMPETETTPATDPETQPETSSVTEPESVSETPAVTLPETEPITVPETIDATASPTIPTTKPETASDSDPTDPNNGGCGSVLVAPVLPLLLTVAAGAVTCKRRRRFDRQK